MGETTTRIQRLMVRLDNEVIRWPNLPSRQWRSSFVVRPSSTPKSYYPVLSGYFLDQSGSQALVAGVDLKSDWLENIRAREPGASVSLHFSSRFV